MEMSKRDLLDRLKQETQDRMDRELVTVLLKLKPGVRESLKKQAAQHKLSMQKVVEALVEGWLYADAPNPLTYGKVSEVPAGGPGAPEVVDQASRAAIVRLNRKLDALQREVEELTADKRMSAVLFGDTDAARQRLARPDGSIHALPELPED